MVIITEVGIAQLGERQTEDLKMMIQAWKIKFSREP